MPATREQTLAAATAAAIVVIAGSAGVAMAAGTSDPSSSALRSQGDTPDVQADATAEAQPDSDAPDQGPGTETDEPGHQGADEFDDVA